MSRYVLDKDLLDLGIERPALGDDGLPVNASHGGYGKWRHTGAPHKGWKYVLDEYGNPVIFHSQENSEYELGFPLDPQDMALCEMCEKARILFIHMLVHPDYPGPLFVGRHCAGHMIGNPDLADKLEKDAKWLRTAQANCKAEWESRLNGNSVANVWGFVMTVRRSSGGFKGWFKHKPSTYSLQSNRAYPTLIEAKRVTVNAMLKARRNKPWKQKQAI